MTIYTNSSFFKTYTPPPSPPGTIPVSFVNDMVAFNLFQTSSVTASLSGSTQITYNVGASGSFQVPFVVKNVTTNTPVSVSLHIPEYFTATTSSFQLLPGQQKTSIISLNKIRLNNSNGLTNQQTTIRINMKNLAIPSQSVRDITTQVPQALLLPLQVNEIT